MPTTAAQNPNRPAPDTIRLMLTGGLRVGPSICLSEMAALSPWAPDADARHRRLFAGGGVWYPGLKDIGFVGIFRPFDKG